MQLHGERCWDDNCSFLVGRRDLGEFVFIIIIIIIIIIMSLVRFPEQSVNSSHVHHRPGM